MISVVSLFTSLIRLVDMCHEAKSTMVDVTEEEAEEDGIKGTEDEGILDVLNDNSASILLQKWFFLIECSNGQYCL